MSKYDHNVSRRQFVGATGLTAAAGLGGCIENVVGGTDEPLEVLHGWTSKDGATAVKALTDAFEQAHPDVPSEFTPISGGGNENLNTVVSYRLGEADPPSSFANWPGKNLKRYEGQLGIVDDVWEENGFRDVHVEEAIDLHRQGSTFRGVPLGSHRLNELFYNVEVLEAAGVDPSGIDTLDALIDALDAVNSETDAIPMTHAMAGTWTTTQLWAAVMLGQEGFRPYLDFVEGNGARGPVRSAFETLANILENYVSYDAASLTMTGSINDIITGEAAFMHQGNWAAGAFGNADGFEYEEHWGARAFPGTENMYTLHFDSFLYPGNNPSPEKSKTWMAFVGGERAQVAFNRYKGSIPTRTDVDMDEFNRYLQRAAADFQNAEHRPPTLQHGLAVVPAKMSALNDVIAGTFTGPYDVEAATSGFLNAV